MTDARSRPGSRISLALTLVIGVFAAACQSAMSIEEAKKVAAAFRGESFPPRTISDVLWWLEGTEPWYSPSAYSPSAQPPDATDRDDLAEFYLRRGLLARVYGTADQERAFLTTALEHARVAGSPRRHRALYEMALAELRAGSFARFIDYARQAIDATPGVTPRVTYMSILVMGYAVYGEVTAAEALLAETTRLFYATLPSVRPQLSGSPAEVAEARAAFSQAQASMLEIRGKYAAAEALYRDAEAFCEAQPSDFARKPETDPIDRVGCARRVNLRSGLVRTLTHQGRLLQAEKEARRILFEAPTSSFGVAALRSLSEVLLEQGRYRESEVLARAAVDIHRRVRTAPDSMELALARAQL